ncbi:hypothetical protein GBF35_48840 [Nonomuraea phyllanthi]|uniref:hypothetical protein n=1 Tax=Nonomuraea phyllanthi TaxID=2219224 RepID=UPI001293BE2B|nr:hypothetical protein [Nonomuraea phyllanthi]QFY13430.1 hypothetical protein GBF35_48840 [Nonomuraea phyllanthi]
MGPSLGHHPPQSALDFAARFDPAWRALALRAYTGGIAMVIGVGSGAAAGVIAWCAHAWRSLRARRNAGPTGSVRA